MPEAVVTKTYRATIKAVDEAQHIVTATISTLSKDRDNDAVQPSGCLKTIASFLKHPILLSSHAYGDLRKQIGQVLAVAPGTDAIEARLQYYVGEGNEEADWAYKLASKGIAAYSLGFIPREWEDGDGEKKPRKLFTDWEMLEVSQVLVPSNRDALVSMRSKALVDAEISEKALDIVTKPEETEDYIRIPVSGEAGKHDQHRIRTIDLSAEQGIKALYCGECRLVITYLFAKAKGWDMAKAQAWIKDHAKKSLDEYETKQGTTSPEPKKEAPEIEQKYGATLSAKTKERIQAAIAALQELLDGGPAPSDKAALEPEPSEIPDLVRGVVSRTFIARRRNNAPD